MTVFTCITNQKDKLQLFTPEDGVRYVCFSDRKFNHPVWEFRPAIGYGQSDPRRVARMYKILSHLWFPGEDTIWMDGRVRMVYTPSYYTKMYKGLICARRHHARSDIYQEAAEIKRINYDDHNVVDAHMERVKDYPVNGGLHETGFLIRYASDQTETFNNTWWSYVSAGSKRDQLSFNYTSHHTGIPITDVDRKDVQVLRHNRPTNAHT